MPGGRHEKPGEETSPRPPSREVEEETGCVVAVEALLGIDCRVSEPEMLLVRFRCRVPERRTAPEQADAGGRLTGYAKADAQAMVAEEPSASRLADALSASGDVVVRRYATRPYELLGELRLAPR